MKSVPPSSTHHNISRYLAISRDISQYLAISHNILRYFAISHNISRYLVLQSRSALRDRARLVRTPRASTCECRRPVLAPNPANSPRKRAKKVDPEPISLAPLSSTGETKCRGVGLGTSVWLPSPPRYIFEHLEAEMCCNQRISVAIRTLCVRIGPLDALIEIISGGRPKTNPTGRVFLTYAKHRKISLFWTG